MKLLSNAVAAVIVAIPIAGVAGLMAAMITVNMTLALISALTLSIYLGVCWLFVPSLMRKHEENKRSNVTPIRK